MKRTTISAVILAIFLTVAGCTSQRYAQYHREQPPVDTLAMMKKQDVISLTKAGVSDSLIITMLATSHSWFQLKTQDVLDLKNAGVSDNVINAMIVSNEPPIEGDRYAQDGYYYYLPYYWYGYYPYWSYPPFYFGQSYWQYYFHQYYLPSYISRPIHGGGSFRHR